MAKCGMLEVTFAPECVTLCSSKMPLQSLECI
jgi:hypothetical protein